MRFRPLLIVPVLVLASSAFAADPPAPPPGPYPIKFDRDFKPGQTFLYTITQSDHSTQKVDTPDGQTDTTRSQKTFVLEGDLTILKIDDVGRESSLKIIVKRFTQQIGTGSNDSLLPRDSEVTVDYSAGAVTFVVARPHTPVSVPRLPANTDSPDAQPGVSDQVQAALQQLFRARSSGKISDDDRYGTTETKKIGDVWAVNAKALSTELIEAEKIAGNVTLKSVKNISGIDCVQLETKYAMRDVPLGELPEGVRAAESTINVLVASDLPIDTTRPKVRAAIKSTSHFIIEQRPNNAGLLRTTIDSEITRVIGWTPKPNP